MKANEKEEETQGKMVNCTSDYQITNRLYWGLTDLFSLLLSDQSQDAT